MTRWKTKLSSLSVGFLIGLTAFIAFSFIAGLFTAAPKHSRRSRDEATQRLTQSCVYEIYFESPEEILSALQSVDVGVRRDVHRRLSLQPGVARAFYDYERDRNYPERAAPAKLTYVNLDDSTDAEALISFVRHENPVALILKREACGWRVCGALTAWLRFEDFPYVNWLELPESVRAGQHEILVRDSTGDATEYVRKVRLLKLTGGALEQIAEFEEETIRPLEGYGQTDWGDVKRRQTSRYEFQPAHVGGRALLRLETSAEVVKYSGVAPLHTFWRETDGAWHNARRHWRARPSTRLKTLEGKIEQFIWDEQRARFVEEEQ